MSSLKSGGFRAFRSRAVSQNSHAFSGVNRGYAITSKIASSGERTSKAHQLRRLLPLDRTFYHLFHHETDAHKKPLDLEQRIPLPSHQRHRNHFGQSTTTQFTDLLNSITHTLSTGPRPSLPALHSLLRAYVSNPDHWSPFAHANPTKQYTRNLVCEIPGVFNLLLLVWTPGKASPVHDHADAHCIMKVLKGEIRETRFAIPRNPGKDGSLVETSDRKLGLNKVAYMADELGVHSISNPHQTEYAVSLHLYFPPNAAMRGCQIYDIENGGVQHVTQGAYDSVKGKIPDGDQ